MFEMSELKKKTFLNLLLTDPTNYMITAYEKIKE